MHPIITAADVATDPEMFLAPILVKDNAPREMIIAARILLFARQQRQVVIAYRRNIPNMLSKARLDKLSPAAFNELVVDHPELLGRFCVGAPCMELRNLSVVHGACLHAVF